MNRCASLLVVGLVVSTLGCSVSVRGGESRRPYPVARSSPPAPRGPAPAPAPPPPPGYYPARPVPPSRPNEAPAPVVRVSNPIVIPGDSSWSLREREQWRDLAKEAQTSLNTVNATCGTNIGGAFVFESFRGRFVGEAYGGVDYLPNYARAPFDALAGLCRETEMEKNSVRRKITGVVISWTTAAASSFTVSGSLLLATVNPKDGLGAGSYQTRIDRGIRSSL